MLRADGSYVADCSDMATFYIDLGGAQFSGYADSFSGPPVRVNTYGTFAYGVLEVLPFIMDVAVGEYAGDRRAGSASANFYGILIVNNDNSPNPDAIFSLQLTPEPSFRVAVGFSLFALVALVSVKQRNIENFPRRPALEFHGQTQQATPVRYRPRTALHGSDQEPARTSEN